MNSKEANTQILKFECTIVCIHKGLLMQDWVFRLGLGSMYAVGFFSASSR